MAGTLEELKVQIIQINLVLKNKEVSYEENRQVQIIQINLVLKNQARKPGALF